MNEKLSWRDKMPKEGQKVKVHDQLEGWSDKGIIIKVYEGNYGDEYCFEVLMTNGFDKDTTFIYTMDEIEVLPNEAQEEVTKSK